jgi:hypothetical protein
MTAYDTDSTSDSKRCTRCGKLKPLTEYYKARKDQLQPHCKQCHKEMVKEWQRSNPERFASFKKKYQQKSNKKPKKSEGD